MAAQAVIFLLLFWHPNFEYRINPPAIEHENGYAYYVLLSNYGPIGYRLVDKIEAAEMIDGAKGDMDGDGAKLVTKCPNSGMAEICSQSTLVVLQDGRPLGPANVLLNTIRARGGGSFTHWRETLYFSTPNNTDPRADGHTYSIRGEYALDTRLWTGLLVIFAALLAVLFWVLRVWFQAQIGPIKVLALTTMLAMAPWAWTDSIVENFRVLFTPHSLPLLSFYLLVLLVCFLGLAVTAFLRHDRLRISITLVLLAGFIVDRAIFSLSGWHSTLELMQTLIREYREAPNVFSSYAYTITVNCIIGIALALAFMVRPPDRWAFRSRYSAIVIGALLGAIALTRISSYSAYALPSPFAVPAQVVVAPLFSPSEARTREAVQYARALRPAFNKIIMIVDESVRGDYLGLNNPAYDNTPYLRLAHANDVIINFGVATSTTNCSAASRLIMRIGLQRHQLPDTEGSWRHQPSIWQYAQKAGFKTVLIESFRSFGSYHSYMNAAEAKTIDLSFSHAGQQEYQRDVAVADNLLDLLKNDGPMFIYVNKYGTHFPYSTKYPPDFNYDASSLVAKLPLDITRRNIVADYHKAIRWSVDGFFAKILPVIGGRPDTLMIYTSDHGQALFEGGYDIQHCSSNPGLHSGEATVPIFASAGPGQFATRLKEQATLGIGQATHFEIFPTLLTAMGYSEDWVHRSYGSSLLKLPLGRQKELLVGAFYSPGAYWIKLGEKSSSVSNSVYWPRFRVSPQ